MQTEFIFRLPRGYLDADGQLHRDGILRLALAKDEIFVLGDPRVKANRAYSVILLLSRVITKLGELRDDEIGPEVIEQLYSSDLAYLQRVYREVNDGQDSD